jgi:hypothetical protein
MNNNNGRPDHDIIFVNMLVGEGVGMSCLKRNSKNVYYVEEACKKDDIMFQSFSVCVYPRLLGVHYHHRRYMYLYREHDCCTISFQIYFSYASSQVCLCAACFGYQRNDCRVLIDMKEQKEYKKNDFYMAALSCESIF